MHRFKRSFLFFAFLLLFVNVSNVHAAKKEIVVGVVSDGQSAISDQYFKLVSKTVKDLVSDLAYVKFKHSKLFDANWKTDNVKKAMNNALNDPKVDIVLCNGILSTQAAARPNFTLKKPVISGNYLFSDLLNLPLKKNDRSSKKNFSFLVFPNHVLNDLIEYEKVISSNKISFLIDNKIYDGFTKIKNSQFNKNYNSIEKKLDLVLSPIFLQYTAAEVLENISHNVKAVYLTPGYQMSEIEWEKLINGLNKRKIKTFSMLGLVDVNKGALAGRMPNIFKQVQRRVALNLREIIDGTKPEDLLVTMPVDEKLYLNMKTAKTINYNPSFDIQMVAQLINYDEAETSFENNNVDNLSMNLSMNQAMIMASKQNLNIAITHENTEMVRQDKNRAASQMFPQIYANLGYNQIDRDRANVSGGTSPNRYGAVGGKITQMLFDDSIISSFREATKFFQSAEFEKKAITQDVMFSTSLKYLQLLKDEALLKINLENFTLTQKNLELAKTRNKVGVSGPEEVYRWEAQLADAKSNVIQTQMEVRKDFVALNKALNVNQNKVWKTKALTEKDVRTYFLHGKLEQIINDDVSFEKFREFSIQKAMFGNRIKALDASSQSQEIKLGQLKRRFFVPKVQGNFEYNHLIDPQYVGAYTQDVIDAYSNAWQLGIYLQFPIFEGGNRFFDVSKAKSELSKVNFQIKNLKQVTQKAVNDVLDDLGFTIANIDLTKIASNRAKLNLNVVQDKYGRGVVSIVDLLDAQNESILQNQNAAIAVYQCMADIMRYQRVISWIQASKSSDEIKDFYQDVKTRCNKQM